MGKEIEKLSKSITALIEWCVKEMIRGLRSHLSIPSGKNVFYHYKVVIYKIKRFVKVGKNVTMLNIYSGRCA